MSTKHRIRGYKRLLQKKVRFCLQICKILLSMIISVSQTIPDEMRVSLTKKLRDLEAKVRTSRLD